MEIEKKNNEIEWYDNANLLTNLILIIIGVIIILSQSFAIKNGMSSTQILSSLLNHNSIYLLSIIYFGFLKTKVGKKYFNYLNSGLIIVYFFEFIASLLTVFQSFALSSLVNLAIYLLLFLYLVHTLLKDTRLWKEFRLIKSPFNEITNEWYFYTIMILSSILLVVNLIDTVSFDGVVVVLLDTIYMVFFARYIYLYSEHYEKKQIIKEAKSKKKEDKKNES